MKTAFFVCRSSKARGENSPRGATTNGLLLNSRSFIDSAGTIENIGSKKLLR